MASVGILLWNDTTRSDVLVFLQMREDTFARILERWGFRKPSHDAPDDEIDDD